MAVNPIASKPDDTDAKSTPTHVEVLKPKPTPVGTPTQIQQRLISTLQSYVGIKEEPPGSNQGKMVNKFNASCGLSPQDKAPWCASVANYAYEQNGLKGRGAYSPSWFVKARAVDRTQAGVADVGLIYFPSKGRYAHTIAAIESVVFSAGRAVEYVSLEGNTNAQGSREGDQFARRRRPADTVQLVRWYNQ